MFFFYFSIRNTVNSNATLLQDIIDLINALFKRRTAPIETNELNELLLYPSGGGGGSAEKLVLNEYKNEYYAQKLLSNNSSDDSDNWVILDDPNDLELNEIEDIYTLVEYGVKSDETILKLCSDDAKKQNNINLVNFGSELIFLLGPPTANIRGLLFSSV